MPGPFDQQDVAVRRERRMRRPDARAEVLDDLDSRYAGIKGRILDDNGELRRFVNVYVGNDDVRFLDNLETPTPDGTQISVIPAVAGG